MTASPNAPTRTRAGTAVRRALRVREGEPRRIPIGLAQGLRFDLGPNAAVDLYLGTFEHEIAPALRALARPGTAVVDVGGQIGWYGLALARLTGAPALVCEADPQSCARIERNVALNPALADLVTVRRVYVAAVDQPAEHLRTLDALVYDEGARADLLKIDVDGGEVEVLRGAQRLLAERRPHVVIETHSPELEQGCADLLVAHGYRPRILTQRRFLRQRRPGDHNRWLVATGAG